jgi:Leucine-rich repeat (LRR) protein
MPKLRDLNVSYCFLREIEGLESLHHLTYLNLWHNGIRRIDGLETAPSLRYVGFGENPYDWNDPTNQAVFARFRQNRLVTPL